MIKFSKLFETVYEPRSGDEKNFKDKHVIMKIKTPYDTESQFTSDKPKAKRKADQEDDVAVYEAAEVHTKRADKEPVIVQAIDPKTGQSRAKTVMRRAGEIKVEEVEQIDELSGDKLRDYYTKAGADRKKARVELKKGLSDLSLSSDDVKNGRGAKSFTSSSVQKTIDASQRFIKRGKGMTLAANKMSEEVEQIDELSDDKLRSYHAKAGADRKKAKAEVEKGMSAKSFTPASVQKTTDSYKRFIKRGKGMTLAANKMSEEVELEEGIDKMSSSKLKYHALNNFPHGSYTRKEIQDEHKRRMRSEPNYHVVKPSLTEEFDLDEKAVNPYAVGMAAAMKATGDRPPLKKSTIIKGHEIAKSIKKEAMDPVGKEDDDIDNDGDVDKSDKYLKNRRKAIGRALQKEDASIDQENSSYTIYKKSNKPNPVKKNPEDAVKEEVEGLDESIQTGDRVHWEDPDSGKRMTGTVHMAKGSKKGIARVRADGTHGSVWDVHHSHLNKLEEDADQLDELSRKTLGSYVKKAAGVAHRNTLPNAMRDRMTAANIGDKEWYKQSGRNADNRSKGIQRAADRLAKEEAEQIDEAFKVGAMKLHDGSSVTLTRESVDSLNSLFTQLNGANKAKMEERMMSGKKGFQEILSFAENI